MAGGDNAGDHRGNIVSTLPDDRSRRGMPRSTLASGGMSAKDKPVEIPDLAATVFHKPGIGPRKQYAGNAGRPFRVADGKPLDFLL